MSEKDALSSTCHTPLAIDVPPSACFNSDMSAASRPCPARYLSAPPVTAWRTWKSVLTLLLVVAALCASPAIQAHQVPGMTMEADFTINRRYTLRINLDPRVFLSDQPTTLPPVAASWYRDQTPEQLKKTEQALMEYLRKNLELHFGINKVPIPDFEIVAIDGSTNEPITDDTQEVHLLATVQAEVQDSSRYFTVFLGREAHVSLILINSMEGQDERKPRVIFPGEFSEPFTLTGMYPPGFDPNAIAQASARKPSEAHLWIWRGCVALGLFLFYTFFLKKRRKPGSIPGPKRHRNRYPRP